MHQLISRQESVKRLPRNFTLHEYLCFEAEDVIKSSWTDVAVHDKKIIAKMRPGETRLFCVHEFGSQLLPLYCRLSEKYKQEEAEYEFSAVEIFMLKLMRDDDLYRRQNQIMRKSARFYFVTVGASDYDYVVAPTSFAEAVDLVFCGKASAYLD